MQQSEVLLWFIVENIVVPNAVTLLYLLFIWLSFLFYFFYLIATDCVSSVSKDYHIPCWHHRAVKNDLLSGGVPANS